MNFNGTNMIFFELSEQLQQRMRFIAIMQQIIGILTTISGAIICIGIVTAFLGVPCLIAGIKLFQSGAAFNMASNAKNGEDLVKAINNLHSYWKYLLIAFILSVVMFIILFIVFYQRITNSPF